jgi:hypothetical protein
VLLVDDATSRQPLTRRAFFSAPLSLDFGVDGVVPPKLSVLTRTVNPQGVKVVNAA